MFSHGFKIFCFRNSIICRQLLWFCSSGYLHDKLRILPSSQLFRLRRVHVVFQQRAGETHNEGISQVRHDIRFYLLGQRFDTHIQREMLWRVLPNACASSKALCLRDHLFFLVNRIHDKLQQGKDSFHL